MGQGSKRLLAWKIQRNNGNAQVRDLQSQADNLRSHQHHKTYANDRADHSTSHVLMGRQDGIKELGLGKCVASVWTWCMFILWCSSITFGVVVPVYRHWIWFGFSSCTISSLQCVATQPAVSIYVSLRGYAFGSYISNKSRCLLCSLSLIWKS